MNPIKKDKKGMGVVEVLIATAIFSGMLVGFVWISRISFRLVSENARRSQVRFLLEEGLEAVRTIRDRSWSSNIAPAVLETAYYLTFSGGAWSLSVTSPGLIDGVFSRTVVLSEVYRRISDDDIVAATSTESKAVDPGTRRVTVKVAWGSALATTLKVAFENGTTDGNLASFPSNNAGDGDPAQGFTTPSGSSIQASRVELFIKKTTSDPSDIFLEIRSGSTVGPILATSQTLDSAALPSSLSWTAFTFSNPPTLNPSTQYFLRLRSIPESTVAFSGSQGYINWGYQQTASSPYAGGDAWRYVGRLSNPGDTGQILTQYDFSFRVFEQTIAAISSEKELSTYLTNIFQN